MENPENENVKTKRDLALDRLKGKYPDREFADDEAVFGQINDDFTDYDERLKGYEEREKAITDMFNADPNSAAFFSNWKNGGNPAVELVRMLGKENLMAALEDPAKLDEIAEADKEFLARVAKSKELQEQYDKNLAESLATMDALQEERGLTDEQANNALMLLKGIMADGIIGKISRDAMEMAIKALNYDEAVATAEHEGEVRGKNTKVQETLRKQKAGDGTAALAGQNKQAAQKPPRPSLGALENYGEGNKNIWERGGENRKRRSIYD